ncbi:MAG: hypothetical protein H6863_03890 [Rhodospirillales bacterium]|nr:hypothetical protein [Rhodospirillales bacterium]
MLILPGTIHGGCRKNPIASLPGLLAYYDSVLSQPSVLPDGRIETVNDLSGNGHHLRVRTEANRIHPTYDQNVFGGMPGIGNSQQGQRVELRSDIDLRPSMSEQQTWFLVYKSYRYTSLRIMAFYDNYHTPIDHPGGMSWGRDENNGFPRTNIFLENASICTFLFQNSGELIIRGNGQQAENVSVGGGTLYNIDPRDNYFSQAYAKYVTLFTGYDINAVEGAFGAVAFCMELLPMPLIQKVERYLSHRFNIPLVE